MASSGIFTADPTSTVAICCHKPVWVVDSNCHRVMRKPCPLCQDPGGSLPGVPAREVPTARKQEGPG